MATVWFLEASCPLTKRFTLGPNNSVLKHPYPHVSDFTSHEVSAPNIRTLFTEIKNHALLGHCLIKGRLHEALDCESRAGATKTNDPTDWICLDLDRVPFASPEAFMKSEPALADVSYIVQYSSSHGLIGQQHLSCHIFVLLDGKVNAPSLKAWLMERNMADGPLRTAITLTRSYAALHWPLDITACQNDKLLYIAPPILGVGVDYSMKQEELIQLVVRKLPALPTARIAPASIDKLIAQKNTLLNAQREAASLPRLRQTMKFVGETQVMLKPGQMTITEIKEERGFRYFNINGGDSWGYYQPVNDIELVHNFKGEPSYFTREIAPDFYREQLAVRRKDAKAPTAEGEIVRVFCELRSAKYFKMLWNPETQDLQLFPAKNEMQLEHFLNAYGKSLHGDFIEQWSTYFNPQSATIVDTENKQVNLYLPSQYYRAYIPTKRTTVPPTIEKIIQSAVSNGENNATYEAFLNWLACIFQYRCKTRTAWVLSGTYGTGKNLVVSKILAPLLGNRYVVEKRNRELEEQWTGWLETALVAYVDEVQVSSSKKAEQISQDLKNLITEPTASIRRMNIDPYQAPSYVNFIFGTNKRDPVQLDEKDRRYNFGDYQDKPLQITDDEIDAQLPKELSLFFNYMMQRTADKAKASKILVNATRKNVVTANLTSIDVVCNALAKGDLMFLWESRPDIALLTEHTTNVGRAFNTIMEREAHAVAVTGKDFATMKKLSSRLSRDELMVMFEFCIGNMPQTPNKFTIMLRHHNIATKKVRVKDRFVMGIEVEWAVPLDWLEEHKTEFTPKPPGLKAIPGGKA